LSENPNAYNAIKAGIIESGTATLHGNIGINYLNVNKENHYLFYWGVGTQVRAYKGLHLIGEVISSDPYDPGTGLAFQAG